MSVPGRYRSILSLPLIFEYYTSTHTRFPTNTHIPSSRTMSCILVHIGAFFQSAAFMAHYKGVVNVPCFMYLAVLVE